MPADDLHNLSFTPAIKAMTTVSCYFCRMQRCLKFHRYYQMMAEAEPQIVLDYSWTWYWRVFSSVSQGWCSSVVALGGRNLALGVRQKNNNLETFFGHICVGVNWTSNWLIIHFSVCPLPLAELFSLGVIIFKTVLVSIRLSMALRSCLEHLGRAAK